MGYFLNFRQNGTTLRSLTARVYGKLGNHEIVAGLTYDNTQRSKITLETEPNIKL